MADEQAVATRPARGTRPRNRRQLIVGAAADLFSARGYGEVAMSDVAEAVAIGPSALYRHFRSKHDLLATVIDDAVGRVDEAVATAGPSDTPAALAAVVVAHRNVGVLWRREARHLTDRDRERLRTLARRTGDRLATRIRDQRPELGATAAEVLAWCALGVANSISFHALSIPDPAFTTLMTELVAVPLRARIELSSTVGAPGRHPRVAHSRREAILSAATALFSEHGYSGVSIDDIGAAVGIAGPSVYNHFAAKTDILSAVMFRGNEWLWMDFNRAVADAHDPAEALRAVIRSYRDFAFNNPHTVQILLSEASQLAADDRNRSSTAQRAYIDEWVHLARQLHPVWSATEARIRVQACQIMINDIVVMRRLRTQPGVAEAVADIGFALLDVEIPQPR